MFPQVLPAPRPTPQAAPTRREPAIWKAVVVASLVLHAAIAVVPGTADRFATLATHGVLLALLFVTLGIALTLRRWDATHAALVATLYLGAYCLPIVGGLWPLPLAVILAAYGAVLACVPAARASARFWQRGTIDRTSVLCMVGFTVAAAIALVTWRFAAGVDMTRYRQFVPDNVPAWAIFAGIVPYAMFNAAFEEIIWRGVVWQAAEAAFSRTAALVLSSVSFGLAHYRGFPRGALGVGLALIYGFMMGFVRLRTRGLLGPWLAHIFADVVIFTMVAAMVAYG
jgi:membrane protease YdiL (CAAX protease family)